MDQQYTSKHRELIPDKVGTVEFDFHVQKSFPEGVSGKKLMEAYIDEMHPSHGDPKFNSRFGGIYLGRYYEGLIQESSVDVWAYNEDAANDIGDIIDQLVESIN